VCGICGLLGDAPNPGIAGLLESMVQSLRHRGPDGCGTWLDPAARCGLGHTRLAIIDLGGGAQPMISADGRYVIVFNGEIYNYMALRETLVQIGHSFRTRSDTEVLLAALAQWGADCLARLDGMFAFAVLDTREQTLFLARDRVGIKPLYYCRLAEGFAFGSEIKCLFRLPGAPRRLDRQALVDHLIFGYPLGPKTFFQDVRELPPGHWMRVGPAGAVREGCFWSWQRQERAWDDGEALEAAKETLTRTLRSHLVADVPIAALLSGGVDSSLLVSLLARELGADLQTFTVRFEDSAYDESPYARLVAKHLGIRHHEIEVSHGGPLLDEIQQIMDRFDQPFADSSAIPTFLVSREIRKHAKVAIGGDGGDEMFGGYPRFHYADVAQRLGRLPAGMLAALRWVTRCAGGPLPDLARKAGRVLAAASARGAERLQDLVCYVYPHMLADVLSPAALETVRGYVPGFGADGAAGCCDGRQLIDATVKYALPGDYLRKVDMMSAAHGLEVRVPYLGAAVLDFAATLPRRLKYRGSRSGKLLLRELLRSYVPPAVLRRPKTGFAIPIDRVLSPAERREVHALLCGRDSCIPQFFNSAYLTPLLEAFVSQQWDRSRWSRYMIYQQVYLLWSLDRWLRCWKPSL
jgi:asparagine synthase (glutamine-hydrolysing)